MSRRRFLKLVGEAGVVAGVSTTMGSVLTACTRKGAPVPASKRADGFFKDSVGVCRICNTWCSYIAEGGDHFELRGNPHDPIAGSWGDGKGRLCVKGYAGPEKALNPDRIFYPMKRTNPKKGPDEDPGFVKISWDEAFEIAAKKYAGTVEKYGDKGVALIMRSSDWSKRFAAATTVPNSVGHQATCFTAHCWAWPALCEAVNDTGARAWTHDFGSSTYLLSFGFDQVGRAQNSTVQGVIKALEAGAKGACFDPQYTVLANKLVTYGGHYYPIKPGTDSAVIWAMIKWIVVNKKYNAAFINTYVPAGEWQAFQAFVAQNGFAPGLGAGAGPDAVAAWAAGLSEVPATEILRVAREFCNDGDMANWRPIVMTHKRDGAGGPNYSNSWRSAYAELVLGILMGSVDRRGADILGRKFKVPAFDEVCPPPKEGYPEPEYKEPEKKFGRLDQRNKWTGAAAGQGTFDVFKHQLIADDPYKIRMLIMSYYNWPMNSTDTAQTVEAMQKCFVVNHCFYADEGAWMSDLLLPDVSYYEKTEVIAGDSNAGQSLYSFYKLQEPLIDKLGDTKGFSDVLYGLAQALDKDGRWKAAHQAYADAQNADWKAANPDYMKNRATLSQYLTVDGTLKGEKWGAVFVSNAQLKALATTADSGWPAALSTVDAVVAKIGTKGDGTGIYPTYEDAKPFTDYGKLKAGQIHLDITAREQGKYATLPDPKGGAPLVLSEKFPGYQSAVHYGKPAADPAGGYFHMLIYREQGMCHTESKDEEMMVELFGPQKVDMHPDSAARLGISEGDSIRIESEANGAVQTSIVHLTPHIRPDCVKMAHGWGHWKFGSRKPNPNPKGVAGPARSFGMHACAGIGADDNAFVHTRTLKEAIDLLDPSATVPMSDVILKVSKSAEVSPARSVLI